MIAYAKDSVELTEFKLLVAVTAALDAADAAAESIAGTNRTAPSLAFSIDLAIKVAALCILTNNV